MNAKWLPALAVPALLLGSTAASGAAASQGVINSHRWAGYEAVANGSTVQSFQYVQATFTVPGLNCAQTSTASATQAVVLAESSFARYVGNWAETAVVESCQNGSPAYSAYGAYNSSSDCSGSAPLPVAVSPGDDVELTLDSGLTSTIHDLTTGVTRSTTSERGSCAILTTAAVFTSGSPVADFTQAAFHQIQVEASGQSTPQPLVHSGWSVNKYVLKGSSGRADVKPEALLSGTYTSAFVNDWLAPN